MTPSETSRTAAIALTVLAVVAALLFLRTASALFIPIVVAVLVSYALEPVVERMERLRVNRSIGAAVLLVALAGSAALGLYELRDEMNEAVRAVPQAARRAGEWISAGGSVKWDETVSTTVLQRSAGWIAAGAGHLTIVVFLTYFLLVSGEHFKRRFIELAGPRLDARRITIDALGEIERQIQRYLAVLAVTSAVVGAATWAGLAVMGVRQAAVWGILAGVFNSIPYFGPVIITGGLLAVGFLQSGDPSKAFTMAAMALAITSLEGWVLTPLLLGKFERMHVLVVFLGILLWTWLWGAWGTVLAVPMLAVIKAICDHVEPLKPLSRLLAR